MICIITVIKNRDEKEVVDNQCENDYISFEDFITPNLYIRIKNTIDLSG